MKYKISPILLILTFFLQLASHNAYTQRPDSVYIVPKTPFVSQLMELKALNVTINLSEATRQIPVHDGVVDGNAQQLI